MSGAGRSGLADDGGLVMRALQGCQLAHSRLYQRHAPAVQMAVADRVGDRAAVADVTQEAFIRAFQRLGSLREPSDFRPWLLQIARHAAVDHRRRIRPVVSLDEGTTEMEAPTGDVQEECLGREAERTLGAALQELPAKDASALRIVRANGGPDYEVLARALGTTPDNARSIVHRARRRLLAVLAERWDLPIPEARTEPDASPHPNSSPNANRRGAAP